MALKGRLIAGGLAAVLALAGGLIVRWEGTRHVAYRDSGGVWTVCTGHTAGVKAGDVATDAQCAAWLKQDMADAAAAVDRCITAPLTVNARAALIDAAFNLGQAVVCGSTLQRLANAGDLIGACRQLTDAQGSDGMPFGWSRDNGEPVRGLMLRRIADRNLCMRGLRP